MDRRLTGREEALRRVASGQEEPPVVARVDDWGVPEVDERGPDVGYCLRDTSWGGVCERSAGFGTDHAGFGPCKRHGGNTRVEREVGAWAMAHAFARELGVTPWDSLLVVVKRQAAKCQWYHEQLSLVDGPGFEPLPGGEHFALVREAERADTVLARFAKQAVDAGVAKMLAERVQLEVEAINRVMNAGLTAAELTREQEIAFRQAASREARELAVAQRALETAQTAAR